VSKPTLLGAMMGRVAASPAAGGRAGAPPAVGAPGQLELTLLRGEGNEHSFTLRPGGILRIGRSAGNEIVVDVDGVSSHHADLQWMLPTAEAPAPPELPLCIRDKGRNGTGVRREPEAGGGEVAWEKVPTGEVRWLGHGWQLKVPLRSRQGTFQMSEAVRTLTVRIAASVTSAAASKPGDSPALDGGIGPPEKVSAAEQPTIAAQVDFSNGTTGSSSSKGGAVEAPVAARPAVTNEVSVQAASVPSRRATVGVPAVTKSGATPEAVAGAVVEALSGGRADRAVHVGKVDGRGSGREGVEASQTSKHSSAEDVVVVKDEEEPKRVRASHQEHATVARIQSAVATAEAAVAVVEAEAARQAGARAKRGARRSRRPAGTESAGEESSPDAEAAPPSLRHREGAARREDAEAVLKPSSFRPSDSRGMEGMPRDMSISPISEPGVGRKRKRRKPRESSDDNVEEKAHGHAAKRKKAKKADKVEKAEKPEKLDKAERAEKPEKADDRKAEDKKVKKKKRRSTEAGAKADHQHHRSSSPHRPRGGTRDATEGSSKRSSRNDK